MACGDRGDNLELERRPDDVHLDNERVVDILEDAKRWDGFGDHGLGHR